MRTRLLPLLAAVLLLLAWPAALHADDEDETVARLERRVELLLDLVAELHAEVQALRERVARLEAEAAEEPPASAESAPASGPGPTPGATQASPAGIYDLDADASVAAILERQLEGVEDEEEAETVRMTVEAEFEGLAIVLRVEPDGKFFVRLEGEGDEHTARGTWVWTAAIPRRLELLTTHEDGEVEEDPTALIGTLEGRRLTLREEGEEEADFVMVFVRR